MATPVNVKDSDSGKIAKVTKYGQLVVAPIQYSTSVTLELDVAGTAVNFVTPEQGSNIVVTDIIVAANRNVSATTPASIEIYTADSATSATPVDLLLSPQLVRSSNTAVTGLNLLVGQGKWVNATTDDDDVLVTIMYYFIPAEEI